MIRTYKFSNLSWKFLESRFFPGSNYIYMQHLIWAIDKMVTWLLLYNNWLIYRPLNPPPPRLQEVTTCYSQSGISNQFQLEETSWVQCYRGPHSDKHRPRPVPVALVTSSRTSTSYQSHYEPTLLTVGRSIFNQTSFRIACAKIYSANEVMFT